MNRSSLFQRRHYRFIATTISELPEDIRERVAEHFGRALVGTNNWQGSSSGFNRERFLTACRDGVDHPPPRTRTRSVRMPLTCAPSGWWEHDAGTGVLVTDLLADDPVITERMARTDAVLAEWGS